MTTPTAASPHSPEHALAVVTAPNTGRTWTVTTDTGLIVSGYLPSWAREDPSQTGMSVERLWKVLADICHWAEFPGQSVRVACDGGPGTDAVVLGGSIDHHPYAADVPITPTPAAVLPVVNLQIIGDYWVHDLGPGQLAVIIGKLRAQADFLDHELRPALIAARADWIAQAAKRTH